MQPAEVPADRAGRDATEHDPGLPRGAHRRAQVVHVPDGEQVGDRAAVDPHDVGLEQVARHVVEVGHREQVEAGDVEPGDAPGLVRPVVHVPRVAGCRADEGQARAPAVRAGQLDRVVHQAVELELGAASVAVATGGGEDRGGVGRHADHPRWPCGQPDGAGRATRHGGAMDDEGDAVQTVPHEPGERRESRCARGPAHGASGASGAPCAARGARVRARGGCSRAAARARCGPGWPSTVVRGWRSRWCTPTSARSRRPRARPRSRPGRGQRARRGGGGLRAPGRRSGRPRHAAPARRRGRRPGAGPRPPVTG